MTLVALASGRAVRALRPLARARRRLEARLLVGHFLGSDASRRWRLGCPLLRFEISS